MKSQAASARVLARESLGRPAFYMAYCRGPEWYTYSTVVSGVATATEP